MQNNCREKFGGMKKTLYLCNECATTVWLQLTLTELYLLSCINPKTKRETTL